MNENGPNIIAFNGGKRVKPKKDSGAGVSAERKQAAKVEVEGEIIELGAFVLSGETPEGKRILLTWSCSPDEMTAFAKTLDIAITKKIEEIMEF